MKSITGYIICIVLAFLYTVFLDGKCGVIFLTVLFVAPVISISMTFLAKKTIEMNVKVSTQLLNKGENTVLSVTFKKTGVIPAPFIEVNFFNAQNFTTSMSKYTFSIRAGKPITINQTYTARIWGTAAIGIEEATITDYLGFVKFSIYKERGLKEYSSNIKITPKIQDSLSKNELMKVICDAVTYDDNEETKEKAVSAGGFPGYEHRNYTPGDPIKRINWKLSSKLDVLMIRLDEAISSSKQIIVLDCCNNQMTLRNHDEIVKSLLHDEKIVESVLAMLSVLVKQGIECVVYFFSGKEWIECLVETYNDITALQYNFAGYKFLPQTKGFKQIRIPLGIIAEKKNLNIITIFTSSFDDGLYNQIQYANQVGVITHTVVAEPTKLPCENVWIVNDTFEFKSL